MDCANADPNLVLQIGAWLNVDPDASREEREGFDFVDKESIEPAVRLIRELQSRARPRAVSTAP